MYICLMYKGRKSYDIYVNVLMYCMQGDMGRYVYGIYTILYTWEGRFMTGHLCRCVCMYLVHKVYCTLHIGKQYIIIMYCTREQVGACYCTERWTKMCSWLEYGQMNLWWLQRRMHALGTWWLRCYLFLWCTPFYAIRAWWVNLYTVAMYT